MNKSPRTILALLLAISLFVLSGCQATGADITQSAQTTPATDATTAEPTTVQSQPATSYPLTVTDQLGRTVTLAAAPQRIISGYYISTSLLIALGLEDQLVGIEDKPGKRPIYGLSAPQLLDLPTVGTAKDFNLEAALALKPDLVILPIRLKEAIETLDTMGVPTLGINPESMDLLIETIKLTGLATGTIDRANALVDRSQALTKKAADLAAGQSAQRLYFGGNSELLSTAGPKMYQSSLITQAGAVNVAADITDTYWAKISYEQLLDWQPDHIILASDATYTVEAVLADPALQGLSAIQAKAVSQMPGQLEAWDSPVPSGVLGQLYLIQLLYPQQYSAAELATDVDAFYRDFYDFEAAFTA